MIVTKFISFNLLVQQRLPTGIFQHRATPQTIPLMARQKRKMICRVKTIIIKLRPPTMLLLNKSSKRSHLIRLSRTVRRNTRKLLRPPRLRQPLSITLRALRRNTTFLQDFFLGQHRGKIIIDAEITPKSLRHKQLVSDSFRVDILLLGQTRDKLLVHEVRTLGFVFFVFYG